MTRRGWIFRIGVLGITLGSAALALPAPTSDAQDPDEARIAEAVAGELRSLHASTATELIEGAPARPLIVVGSFALEHGDGRGRIVLLGLASGPPGDLGVPTEIEYLRYTVRVEDDGIKIFERPRRDDLVTGVTRVLADEAKAMDAAAAALTAENVELPAGRANWRAALRSVTYDARLPRARFAGEPMWSFVFEPWRESQGGWNFVLLDAGLSVRTINGRHPQR